MPFSGSGNAHFYFFVPSTGSGIPFRDFRALFASGLNSVSPTRLLRKLPTVKKGMARSLSGMPGWDRGCCSRRFVFKTLVR